jgi:hypothetical protein
MRRVEDDRVGLLTIRVWVEPGVSHWFARVTKCDDVESGIATSSALDDTDAVYSTVKEWLEDFIGGQ